MSRQLIAEMNKKIEKSFGKTRKINNQGYVMVLCGVTWVLEHKIVVENFIERSLTKDEVVHHLDFCKTNNDINNLMIFPSQKEHQKFHLKLKQFGMTNPIIKQINERWDKFK